MRREIKRLHTQTGVTALYVTHDQEEALSIADRIAVLKDGALQQVGSPRDLYRHPRTRFVAEFIGETNFLPGIIENTDDQFLTIATPAGALRAARIDGDWQSGQQIWCSIRPEAWRVDNSVTENRLGAQLESVMYLGESEQYQARLTGEQNSGKSVATENEDWRQIKIAVTNPGEQAPRPGDAITLTCAPSDIVPLAQ
jgi:ABC-type Fe3+/spermidine/putrescine transport system ATPase subunit